MIYLHLLISTILILCGFLVKLFPNLIAGYNYLPKEEKDKIDITKLSLFLKRIFICAGAINFLSFLILDSLNINEYNILFINTVLIVIVIVIAAFYADSNFKK